MVVLADRSRPAYLYDGCLVMRNLLLAAHDLGLGSCWMHRAKQVFDSPEGKTLLKDWGIEGITGESAIALWDISLGSDRKRVREKAIMFFV